mgnify:CR=1 FL=1
MREIYILLSLLCTTLLWGQQPLTQVQANAFKEKVVEKICYFFVFCSNFQIDYSLLFLVAPLES